MGKIKNDPGGGENPGRRADAVRNIDALLDAAKTLFAASGVDAPAREVAALAGVGVGTLYRHFPDRPDLIASVLRREVDACAAAAASLAAAHEPGEALTRWLRRYARFIAAKRGLASALHSGNPAYGRLPAYFSQHLEPALKSLLDSAVTAGMARADVEPIDLLWAVGNLCRSSATPGDGHAGRMIGLLIDGLRYRGGGRRKRQ